VAGKWDTTALAGQLVLVAQYFQDGAEREETGRRKTVVLDADDPCEEEADKPGADDLEEEQEEEGPPDLNPFHAPEKSHATRHRKEKSSFATGVWFPTVRKLDKYMSRQEFVSII
jgi:hypothetical protein